MPPANEPTQQQVKQLVKDLSAYPPEAYDFVQRGLSFTVEKIHRAKDAKANRHVNGQQLCQGLREFALRQWGLMAGTVLERWGIRSTYDFGRIVFAMIEVGQMKKTAQDSIEDFRDVYEFKTAFEAGYRIPMLS